MHACGSDGLRLTAVGVLVVLGGAGSLVARTWYVDPSSKQPHDGTSWRRAYTELQEALAAAGSGDEIWVAQGTCRPDYDPASGLHTGNRSAHFALINGKRIYGGFPPGGGDGTFSARDLAVYETVLSGDLLQDDVSPLADGLGCWSGSGQSYRQGCADHDADADGDVDDADLHIEDNSYQVVTVGFAATTVDGFTITAGHANGPSHTIGGGIATSANLTLANCRLVANSALGQSTSDGGAVDIRGQLSLTMTHCRFEGNVADRNGGAICAQWGTTIQATSCDFINNRTVRNNGGAVYKLDLSSGTFRDCTFIGNTSGYYGAAIHSENTNLTLLVNCTFESNRSPACGGAIVVYDTQAIATGCTFVNNSCANSGGAIYGGNLNLSGCVLIGNSTDSAWGGGGAVQASGTVSLRDCDLIRNKAGHGGAVSAGSMSQVEVMRCRFLGNTALAGGGAYEAASGDGTSPSLLSNCAFVGNQAATCGGAVACLARNVSLYNCSLVANTAGTVGGGLYNSVDWPPSLYSSIFWDNKDSKGATRSSQMANAPGVWRPINTYYCCVQYGTPDKEITVPPGFVREPSPGADGAWGTEDDDCGDIQLQTGSPCIDAGTGTGGGSSTDLAGQPRRVDDPCVPDSGSGTPPIVDIGAYEHVPTAPADFDYDFDVDGDDVAIFEACASGPGVPMAAGCGTKDLDRDGDVDQSDFGVVQRCLSGSGVEAEIHCAE